MLPLQLGTSDGTNGCPNSCTHPTADIGLMGRFLGTDCELVDGIQVPPRRRPRPRLGMGRTLRGHKVTSADLRECIARVVTDFVNARRPGERFPAWLARAGEGELI